jgi:hypothetical protein
MFFDPTSKRRIQPVMNAPSNSAATPQVGQIAPEFELPDSTGVPHRLSELTASGLLVLLFYRGHW